MSKQQQSVVADLDQAIPSYRLVFMFIVVLALSLSTLKQATRTVK